MNTNGVNGPESHWVHPNEQERSRAGEKEKPTYAPPPGAPPTSGSSSSTPAYNSDNKNGNDYNNSNGQQSSASPAPYSQSSGSGVNERDGKKGGFLGKIFGGNKNNNNSYPGQQGGGYGRPQQMYGGGGMGGGYQQGEWCGEEGRAFREKACFILYSRYHNREDFEITDMCSALNMHLLSVFFQDTANNQCTVNSKCIPNKECIHNKECTLNNKECTVVSSMVVKAVVWVQVVLLLLVWVVVY